MDAITDGLRTCFARLSANVEEKFGQKLTTVGAIGISGMMHGYLPFDSSGNQLAEFRTWRNTMTRKAAGVLSEIFNFNVPQRWSISHLYQAILNEEAHLLTAIGALKIGLNILIGEENVVIEKICGHGGFFKTPGVGQRMLSAAVGAPVSVMDVGEGGPYGMALLAAYSLWKSEGELLEDYLEIVFATTQSSTLMADTADMVGFDTFLARYQAALPVEKAAVESI